MRHSLLTGLFLLLSLSTSASAQEHSSEWFYVDERWPTHIGPLFNEKDPDAYIHQVVGRESQRLSGWNGRQGTRALDTVTACGLTFDGYLRQRPRGNYLVVVIGSADGQNHKLQWLPVEYRFDNQKPEYFMRRDGSPSQEPKRKSIGTEEQQQDVEGPKHGRPDIRTDPNFRLAHKYLFDNGSPLYELRTRGEPEIQARYKYIEVVKFPVPRELARHELLQIYLPWIESCDTKPSFVFERHPTQEVIWDYPMTAWLTAGFQAATSYRTSGWGPLDPQPGGFLHFSDFWPHHGISTELVATNLHSADATGKSVVGFLGKASYGYSFWPTRYFAVIPNAGFRTVFGVNGFMHPGWGTGVDAAWEVPGTRHQTTGQRLLVEGGCDFSKYYEGTINTHDLRGNFISCRIGFGLGW